MFLPFLLLSLLFFSYFPHSLPFKFQGLAKALDLDNISGICKQVGGAIQRTTIITDWLEEEKYLS